MMNLVLISLLVIFGAPSAVTGLTVVTGAVFCDQCKDGQISIFDVPTHGVKVQIVCPTSDGGMQVLREETTSWLGVYAIRLDGAPDLSSCLARVAAGGKSNCSTAAGPPKSLRLVFNVFGLEMYTVDILLSQPAAVMPFCSRTPPSTPPISSSPPVSLPPRSRHQPPPSRALAPMPYLQISACPYQKWSMPEHRCYWKVVTPDTKVAVVFGPVAANRYGTEMTLGQAMRGRGDPYRTLLREATTALLNSYDSMVFPYQPLGIIQGLNMALSGSNRQVLRTALRFLRANSGATTHASCRFTSCK